MSRGCIAGRDDVVRGWLGNAGVSGYTRKGVDGVRGGLET